MFTHFHDLPYITPGAEGSGNFLGVWVGNPNFLSILAGALFKEEKKTARLLKKTPRAKEGGVSSELAFS